MKTFSIGSRRRQEAQIKNCRWPMADGRFKQRGFGGVILFFTLLFAANLFAADLAADFSSANELYAKGKFADAAAAYGKILQTGASSPALLFNAGNAEFKAGHLGRAIAAYRRAELLAPRDLDLRQNLKFVRNQVPGAAQAESHWPSWAGALTLDEGAVLTAVAFWLTLALFTARQLRPALGPKLKTATRLGVALTLGFGTVLGLQAANHFASATAVVTADNATARSGPFDDAQSVFTSRDGAELSVLDRRDGWVQVATSAGKSGWLPLNQAEVLPGA